jgi:hypothetical protein
MATPQQLKKQSEATIRAAGGKICDWLPIIERGGLRSREDIVARALILNALLNIYFGAPIKVIADWIKQHGLQGHLSKSERALLKMSAAKLTQKKKMEIYWFIEALWALMWVGKLIPKLPFDKGVGDNMASLCPNLEKGEGPEKFTKKMKLRSEADVMAALDLHYRLHWWTRDGNLNGYDTGNVSLDIIMERRKALEWVMDADCDWDDVPDST